MKVGGESFSQRKKRKNCLHQNLEKWPLVFTINPNIEMQSTITSTINYFSIPVKLNIFYSLQHSNSLPWTTYQKNKTSKETGGEKNGFQFSPNVGLSDSLMVMVGWNHSKKYKLWINIDRRLNKWWVTMCKNMSPCKSLSHFAVITILNYLCP